MCFRGNWDTQKAITSVETQEGTKANILLLVEVP